jgi:peptide/nickel transport system substrate-binding protein
VAAKGGLNDEEDLIELLRDSPRGDAKKPALNTHLQAVSTFWNSGFDARTLPGDPAVYLSNGPYIVRDIVPESSVTLVRNKDYVWGPEPYLDEVTIQFTDSVPAAVDALRSGRADIISPQPSAGSEDLFGGLEGQGIAVQRFSQSGYDHLDLNFSSVFAEDKVREAFLKTVPRKDIVEGIVGDLMPDAKPLDSHVFLPSHPKYSNTVKDNGSSEYADVDIEGAASLLEGATPTVRILYNTDNPNRVRAFELIRDSAARAGFRVLDAGQGSADWAQALDGGTYDAAILGWISTGVGVGRIPQIFRTGAGSNFNGFSDAAADRAMQQLSTTTDLAKQDELMAEIDKRVWESDYGLPLYQTTGTTAVAGRIAGVKSSGGPLGVWWNVWEWRLK